MSWWRRLTQGVIRHSVKPEWTSAVGTNYAQSLMTWQVTDQFHTKQGRSTGRLILTSPLGEKEPDVKRPLVVYLKRHWQFPWWCRIGATLWPSRNWSPAAQEWENLLWAQQNDIPVPEPVAMGEFIGPWFNFRSYLAIRELSNMLPLHEAIPSAAGIMTAQQFLIWKRNLVREMARLTTLMHHQHRYHKDLYLCHFFIPTPTPTESTPKILHLIDFHRLGHHRLNALRWQIKDLAQLLYSTWSLPDITDKDRWRFFHIYFNAPKLTFLNKCLWRLVLYKAKRYARHNHVALPRNCPLSTDGDTTASPAVMQCQTVKAA